MNANPNQTNPEDSQKSINCPAKLARRKFLTTFGIVAGGVLLGGNAFAKSAVKMTKWGGTIQFSDEGFSPFTLKGTASHLGRFTAYGEIEFLPGVDEGSLVGDGIIVFEAANSDLLVGAVSWYFDGGGNGGGGRIHDVRWRDSVEFSDGRVVFSTGRFVQDRPPGIVTIEYLVLGVFLGLALISAK